MIGVMVNKIDGFKQKYGRMKYYIGSIEVYENVMIGADSTIMYDVKIGPNAIVAAEMALADIKSVIPADEVIIAMKRVGDGMPRALKETAEGGLAKTPTAERLAQQIFGSNPN